MAAKNVNLIQRLFGNENNERRQPTTDDYWLQRSIDSNAANAANQAAVAAPAQSVDVASLPRPRDPRLIQSVQLNLTAAGSQQFTVKANTVLYADSTTATDRLQLLYQDSNGDQTQPLRSMVPGRLRRERYFTFLTVSWVATPGSVATIEIYDDPDGALYIQD